MRQGNHCGIKMRTVFSLLICLIITLSGFNAQAASLSVNLNPTFWFKTVEEMEVLLADVGYDITSDSKTGVLKNVRWEFENDTLTPAAIRVMFDTKTREVTRVSLIFKRDANMFSQLYQNLEYLYGEPSYTEYSRVKEGNTTTTINEGFCWRGDSVFYSLLIPNLGDGISRLEEVKSGNEGFSLIIYK